MNKILNGFLSNGVYENKKNWKKKSEQVERTNQKKEKELIILYVFGSFIK